MTAITRDSRRVCYMVLRGDGCDAAPAGPGNAMKGKISNLAMLMLAVGLLATPARADTLVKVTVRGSDGGPAAGVAVTIRQAAGYGTAAGDLEPPAVVAAAATGSDGTVNLRLASVRPYDVYSVGADDKASGRRAS